jgi:hypothetical protein
MGPLKVRIPRIRFTHCFTDAIVYEGSIYVYSLDVAR